MPTMKSAKKRLRQNIKHNLRNRTYKSALKTQMKKFLNAIREGNAQAVQEELRLTVKKLDTGVTKGILHKNTASRKKSRLAKKLNQMKVSAQQKS
ncbi:MAG: 30S ribosomal protein S20 [Planctomycetes bacterium]|uniref:30S ribosomal protein S20 n=1 Tax=Candidatus Wunengus californicus TaxID=3367619 RepID=UPI0008D8BB27|nr:30S ribosomal protein S20 [Planctomycetota bacterium]MBI4222628.1 30S ribosomal protein S20 [Planctomycetota bacterium]OHC06660.1 MAG: 30S ribosomal protein S20 [Planctomycetes bacterium RIFOXYD12_FULL_42_12]